MRILFLLLFCVTLIAGCTKSDSGLTTDYREHWLGAYKCREIFYRKLSDSTYRKEIDSNWVEFGPGDHDSDMQMWFAKNYYRVKLRSDLTIYLGKSADGAILNAKFYRDDSLTMHYQKQGSGDFWQYTGKKE